MKVVNISRVDYDFKRSQESPIITSTIFSNVVSTFVLQDIIKVCKEVDYRISSVYGILTYRISVENISCHKVEGLYFKDELSSLVHYIADSLVIDGHPKKCTNPQVGVPLSPLLPAQKHVLFFQVIVRPLHSQSVIVNCSQVAFDHVHDISKPPIKHIVVSNYVCTFISNSVFKEESLNCEIHLPLSLPFMEEIEFVQTKQMRFEYKMLPSPKESNSNSPQKVTVLFLFSFEIAMLYHYKKCRNQSRILFKKDGDWSNFMRKQWYTTTIGGSMMMEMPIGVSYLGIDHNAVNVKVENRSTIIKDPKTVMVSYTMFVQVE